MHPDTHLRQEGGLTPEDVEIAIIMGMTILADAVLDVVSLIIIPRPTAMAVIPHWEDAPNTLIKPLPIASARPVENIKLPRVNPPPNRSIVPQSILEASFQVMVNFLFLRSTGRMKRSDAAIKATIPSGR